MVPTNQYNCKNCGGYEKKNNVQNVVKNNSHKENKELQTTPLKSFSPQAHIPPLKSAASPNSPAQPQGGNLTSYIAAVQSTAKMKQTTPQDLFPPLQSAGHCHSTSKMKSGNANSSSNFEANIYLGKSNHKLQQNQLINANNCNKSKGNQQIFQCERNQKKYKECRLHFNDVTEVMKIVEELQHVKCKYENNDAIYLPCKYKVDSEILKGIFEIAINEKKIYHAFFREYEKLGTLLQNKKLKAGNNEKEFLKEKVECLPKIEENTLVTIDFEENKNGTVLFLKSSNSQNNTDNKIKILQQLALGSK